MPCRSMSLLSKVSLHRHAFYSSFYLTLACASYPALQSVGTLWQNYKDRGLFMGNVRGWTRDIFSCQVFTTSCKCHAVGLARLAYCLAD